MTSISQRRVLLLSAIACAPATLAHPAHATTIALANATLNSPSEGSFQSTTTITSWSSTTNTSNSFGHGVGVLNYTATSGSPTTEAPYLPNIAAGTTVAYSNNGAGYQISTDTTNGVITAGDTYTFQISAEVPSNGAPVDNGTTISSMTSNTIALIYLSSGSPTILASTTYTLAAATTSSGSMTSESVSYTALPLSSGLGSQIGVLFEDNYFLGTDSATVTTQTDFDNASLSVASVPEPAAIGFLAAFSVSALARRRSNPRRLRV